MRVFFAVEYSRTKQNSALTGAISIPNARLPRFALRWLRRAADHPYRKGYNPASGGPAQLWSFGISRSSSGVLTLRDDKSVTLSDRL